MQARQLVAGWDDAAEVLNSIPVALERVRYAAAIKPLLALPRSSSILEAGCGSGRILRTLAALGYWNLTGVEISHARLGQVATLGPSSARLVCCDRMPFASGIFDAVVSAAVIEHVDNPSTWLAELARVTRSGGLISIATDTYMWHWLKQLGLYHSIQPMDDAIWPLTLIHWGKRAGLKLVGCGGFVSTLDQRGYLGRELLRLVPHKELAQRCWNQLLHLLPRVRTLRQANRDPAMSASGVDETGTILEAIRSFSNRTRIDPWACIWSWECYYWFRKG